MALTGAQMARPKSQDPAGPIVKTTVWIPIGLRDICRERRLNMSGIVTAGMRYELERIGALK